MTGSFPTRKQPATAQQPEKSQSGSGRGKKIAVAIATIAGLFCFGALVRGKSDKKDKVQYSGAQIPTEEKGEEAPAKEKVSARATADDERKKLMREMGKRGADKRWKAKKQAVEAKPDDSPAVPA